MEFKIDLSECKTKAIVTIEIETKAKNFPATIPEVVGKLKESLELLNDMETNISIECDVLEIKY